MKKNKYNTDLFSFIIASSAYMDERIKNELVGYPYPIILDEFESFKLKNKIIRDDILCSFLIKDSKVIEVGDLKDVSFQNEVENLLKLKKSTRKLVY